jgi:hypothetical protein
MPSTETIDDLLDARYRNKFIRFNNLRTFYKCLEIRLSESECYESCSTIKIYIKLDKKNKQEFYIPIYSTIYVDFDKVR